MDKGSAMTAAETEVEDVRVPLRQGYDHESEPTLLREHHAEWDRLREETPVFRSDIAPPMKWVFGTIWQRAKAR